MGRYGQVRIASPVGARVQGLDELIAALNEIDPLMVEEVKQANRDAAEWVRTKATARGLALGSVAAKAAPTLQTKVLANSAGVVLDGIRYRYALGAEFGSNGIKNTRDLKGWHGSTRQFQPWLGRGMDAGYFLWPTVRKEARHIVERYEEALARVIRKAGLG